MATNKKSILARGGDGAKLTKESSPEEIKSYFDTVLNFYSSGVEFPVDFDDVWPLVYKRRQEAVRGLKHNFIELVDYQALRKDAQRGAASQIEYHLSLSCLEFFIARKVRSVFEVYRKVFHHTVQKQLEQPKNKKRQAPPHMPNDRFGCEAITQKGKGKMLWEEELCVKVTQYENWADLNWSNWVSSKSIKAIKEAVDRMYYVLCGE